MLDDLDGKKIAVLGDMLELGQYEKQGHHLVGARVAEVVDELVTIGEKAKWIAAAASQAGMKLNQIKEFDASDDSVDYLKDHLASNDVVLVKGSRGMQMEIIVTALETVR